MWSVLRCCKQWTRLELSSVRESVKRGPETETEELANVGAVTRKRLVNCVF
jgi:hypothetical protein